MRIHLRPQTVLTLTLLSLTLGLAACGPKQDPNLVRLNGRLEAPTVDISPKGCLAILPQGFTVGQKLRLINLTNQHVCDSILVWRGHEGRSGWELGLELQKMPADFWGLDF